MTLTQLKSICLAKAGAYTDFPFDATTLTFKVEGKLFCLCGIDNEPLAINLKCDPDYALALRVTHEGITAGYHMNKKHWNTVLLDGRMEEGLVLELIQHSYALVVAGLPKKTQIKLQNLS